MLKLFVKYGLKNSHEECIDNSVHIIDKAIKLIKSDGTLSQEDATTLLHLAVRNGDELLASHMVNYYRADAGSGS